MWYYVQIVTCLTLGVANSATPVGNRVENTQNNNLNIMWLRQCKYTISLCKCHDDM